MRLCELNNVYVLTAVESWVEIWSTKLNQSTLDVAVAMARCKVLFCCYKLNFTFAPVSCFGLVLRCTVLCLLGLVTLPTVVQQMVFFSS